MWLLLPSVLLVLLLTTGLVTSTPPDIEVFPSDANRTLFQDGSFRRTCRYTGSQEVMELQILHAGVVIDQEEGATSIMLDVMEAQLTDAGSYTCQIIFTDSPSIIASLGTLTVVDLNLITAPADQYVVAGDDISLQCSFDDPDELYGVVITTIRRGSQTTQTITDTSVEDEGSYQCDVSLVTHTDSTLVPIFLHVFTPINITGSPDNYQELFGVQERSFSVTFTGRQSQNIEVGWYRNGVILDSTSQQQITTTFSEEEMTGRTTIHFPEMRRSEGGVYRVVVSTDFAEDELDLHLQRQAVSFQVDVRVPPPDPTNFEAALVAEHHVQLEWELPISHPDEDVQSFQLEITFPNGSRASLMTLNSSARSAVVSVFPGVSYEAHLIARNTDGLGESKLLFSTPPAAPYVSSFESRRLNETHFNISVSLLYTGGGDTIIFSVYFRELNSIEWSQEAIMTVVLDSVLALEYHGTISGEVIRGKGPLEFELRVENGLGFMNRTGSGLELSDPPGVPTTPMVFGTSDTSVTLNFKLPEEGTPPFINIVLEFSEPQVMARNFTGTYSPGQTVVKEVRDLSPRTAYSLKARAVNYAGNGPSSDTIHFTTNEPQPTTATTSSPDPETDPMSSMSWLIPVICGGAGLLVLVLGIGALCCVCYCCYSHRRNKNANSYTVAKTAQRKDVESGDSENDMSKGTPPTALSDSLKTPRTMAASNPYITVPQHDRIDRSPSNASSSPSNHKWPLGKSNNQISSSTLNSGASATQDSFTKKPDIYSTGSDIQLGSLQSSQQGFHSSHRTSKDSLAYYKRHHKVINPSISSGGSEATTDTTERYQAPPFLSPQVEETYSFQSMPFIPEGSSYSSLTCSVEQPSQCVSDV